MHPTSRSFGKIVWRWCTLVIMAAGCASCSSTKPATEFARVLGETPEQGIVLHNVRALPYATRRDGVASLAPMLAYWNRAPLRADEAKSVEREADPGFILEEYMADVLDRRDLWSYAFYSSMRDLEIRLRAGIPMLIVVQDNPLNKKTRRYMVVMGFNQETKEVLVQEGDSSPSVYSYGMLMQIWRPVRNWALLACPPEKVSWRLRANECVSLAHYFERRQQWYATMAFYQKAEKIAPQNQDVQLAKADALYRFGNKEEAMQVYRDLLLRNNANARAAHNLAYVTADSGGNMKEAERLARRALTMEPANPGYLDTLGFVLLRAGRPREAADVLAKARHRSEYLSTASQRIIITRLIEAYLESGQTHLARQVWNDHRVADPSFVLHRDLAVRMP